MIGIKRETTSENRAQNTNDKTHNLYFDIKIHSSLVFQLVLWSKFNVWRLRYLIVV